MGSTRGINTDHSPNAAAGAPPGSRTLTPDRYSRVAERLRSTLGALVNALPEQSSTVTEMSRYLEIGRAVCQRIVLALRSDSGAEDILQRFPGVRGLEQYLDAAERRQIDASLIASARAAVDEYAALIGAAGGSQRRLLANLGGRQRVPNTPLQAGATIGGNESLDEAGRRRAALFEAAQAITGNRSHARIEVTFFRVNADDPKSLDMLMASGHVGATADEYSVPVARVTREASPNGDLIYDRKELDNQKQVLGISPGCILQGFSTHPLPSLVSRLSGGLLIQVFNPEGRVERPFDIVVGTASAPAGTNPLYESPAIENCGMIIGMPTRWLLMDVYLERSLARQCTPQMSVLRLGMAGPLGHNHPDSRWYDRIPDEPTLELLGPGLARKPSRAYERSTELAAHLLRRSGWSADQFVCFRCEVQYPYWEMEYVMTFNFEEPKTYDIPAAFKRNGV